MSLEPRLMFDGAAVATVADAAEVAEHDNLDTAPLTDDPALDQAAGEPIGKEIVFVVGDTPEWETLVQGVREGVEVVLLDPNTDGLAQMAGALQDKSGFSAIHLVSHGADGKLRLGTLTLSSDNIDSRADNLATIGQALTEDGDLLLYGCDIAATEAGISFIEKLATLTGADIAASSDATGAATKGGDWVLERSAGEILSDKAFSEAAMMSYGSLLPGVAGTVNFNTTDGVLPTPTITDGSAGSDDIANIEYQIYSAEADGTPTGVLWTYYSDLTSDGVDGIVGDQDNGDPIIVIKSADGAEFAFKGITVVDYYGEQSQIRFEGFRNGVSTGWVTLDVNTGTWHPVAGFFSASFDTSDLTQTYFQYVDEVRITNPNSTSFGQVNLLGIDNLVFDDPVIPGPAVPSTPDLAAGSDTGSSSTDNITNDTTPTFTGITTAGATVTLFNDANNNGAVDAGELLGTGTATGGNWSITSSALTAGTYNVRAIASNGDGTSAASTGLSLTIDTTTPAVPSVPDLTASSDRGISNTDNLTNDTTPTFTGTAEAGATVKLYANGTEVGSATADGSGNWSITPSALDEGTYTFTARAEDAAGNLSAASSGLSVTIDATGPVVSAPDMAAASDSGSSDTDNITNVRRPEFTGTAPAGTFVQLFIDNAGNGDATDPLNEIIGTGTASGDGTWSITSTVDLPAWTSSIKARGQDDAGNFGAASSSVDVTIDITPPAAIPSVPDLATGSDTGSSSTDNITNDTTPTFSGTHTANNLVRLYANGVQVGSATADGSGNWTITSDALAAGTYSFTARGVDLAGNEGTASSGLSVTIDNVAPAAPSTPDMEAGSDTGSSDSDNNTEDTTPTFSGSGAEANATVRLYVNGVEVGSSTADGSGNWSVTVDAGMALDAGDYFVVVRTEDAAGNLSAASTALPIHINTAPTANANLSQTVNYTEDPGGSVALGDIVVSDVDPGETITATLTLSDTAAGTLSSGTYGSATSTFNNGTGVWTVTGSVADVNAALAAVAFTPSANWDQNVTITTRIRDANGSGPADGTVTLNVTAVNDAPTATNLTQSKTATEGGSAVALDDIVITDVDTGDTITATLSLSIAGAGTLSTGTYGSATSTFNAGTGVWTVTGSVADVNAALAAVTLTPSADNDQNFTITTRVRDAANQGPADGTITVTVTPVNDAPAVTVPGSITVTEDLASALTGISFSDVDAGAGSVTVTFSVPSGSLAASSGSGVTVGGTASALTLTGTIADINAFIAASNLTFTTAVNAIASVTLTVNINDNGNTGTGGAQQDSTTVTLNVTAVNDAPTVSAPGSIGVQVNEAGAVTGISFADIDAGAGMAMVTLSVPSGSLAASSGSGVTVGGTASALTLTGTIADINAFIAASNVTFTTAADATADVVLTVTVNDNGNIGSGGAQQDSTTVTLTPSERPVVTIGGGSPSYTEDGTAATIATGLTIADGDSVNAEGATVTITDFVSGDVLGFTNQNGIVGSYNAATGVLALTGTATKAQYEAALRSVTYSSTNDNPATGAGNGDRVIEFRVTDGSLQSVTGVTQTLAVQNANDAPVLDASASPSLNGVAEDAVAPVNGSTAGSTLVSALTGGISDVDTGAQQGIAIIGTSAQGTLWYSTDGGTTWTQVPAVSETNALLLQSDARLYFQPAADFNGAITSAVTFRAWDRTSGSNGSTADTTANGGGTAFSTATDTASISVAAVNDAPTIGAGPFTLTDTDEDTASSATAVSTILTGLGAADIDSGAQSGIAITATSGNGTWQYTTNGTDWHNVGTVSSGAALLLDASAQLRYVPDGENGETGGAAPALTFRAWDQTAGTATNGATRSTADVTTNGGTTAYSAVQASATLAVTAVNDAPSLVSGTVPLTGTNENSTSPSTLVSTILASSTVSDVDMGATFGIAITGASGNGTWQYSTNGAAWTAFGTVSDSSALLLNSTTRIRFVGDSMNGGTATFTWRAWDRTSGTPSANGAPEKADTSSNGGSTAFSANTSQASLNVTSVNDAPVLDAGTGGVTFDGGAGSAKTPVVIAPAITVTDVDTGETMASANVTITGNYMAGEDVLAFTPDAAFGNITASFNAGTGTLTLTSAGGTATLAQWQAALRSVTYANSSDTPTISGRVISITLNDGDADSNTVTRTVSVDSLNDAPVVTAPADITVIEDVASPVTGISFADPDAASSMMEVTLSVDSGTLAATSGSGVTVSGSGSATLTLAGSIADLNAFIAANKVGFTTASDRTADVALTVDINDLGNTGSGGVKTDSATVTIKVTPVNDAPVAAGSGMPQIRATIGQPFSFTLPGGLFSDPDAGDILTLSVQDLPDGLSFDPATGTLSGRAAAGATGLHTITITATDAAGISVSMTATLRIEPPSVTMPPSEPPVTPRGSLQQPAAPLVPPSAPPAVMSAFAPGSPAGPAPLITASLLQPELLTSSQLLLDPMMRNGLSQAGTAGFLGILLPDDPTATAPLMAVTPLGEHTVGSGGSFSFVLPPSTFVYSDASAQVMVEVRQANGQPLPAWIRFNPVTGTLTAEPPPGFKGTIDLDVKAYDSSGRQASSPMRLRFGEQGAASSERGEPPVRPQSLLQELPGENGIRIAALASPGDDGESGAEMQAAHGKASLTEQFARYGRAGWESGKSALVRSAEAAAAQKS